LTVSETRMGRTRYTEFMTLPDLQAIDVLKMSTDVADRQTGGVKPDNLVIHPINASLPLLHQFRLEATVPVPRHSDRQFAVLTLQSLA